MNSKYYAKILKSQGEKLSEYDNSISPEKLMQIFPSEKIVYVKYIPPEDLLERYRVQGSIYEGVADRLVYVSPTAFTEFPDCDQMEYIEKSTSDLLEQKYPGERLFYINGVMPEVLARMSPRERFRIKGDLPRQIHDWQLYDLELLANAAIPFFSISVLPEFSFDRVKRNTSLPRARGWNSRLDEFLLAFETELADENFKKLNSFQRCFREAVLNSNQPEDKWASINYEFSPRSSCYFPEDASECRDLFEKYIGDTTVSFLHIVGHHIRYEKYWFSTGSYYSDDKSRTPVKRRPDIVYMEHGVPLVAVEAMGPGFSELVEDGLDESSEAFKSIIRQVGGFFVGCNTTRAIVTNFHYSLFIEIDEVKLGQLKGSTGIPCKYRLFPLNRSGLTVQAALLSWLFFETTEELELRGASQEGTVNAFIQAVGKEIGQDEESLNAQIRTKLTNSSNAQRDINHEKSHSHIEGACDSWTGFEVLQGEGHDRHVYKFKVKLICQYFPFFNQVLGALSQDDLVVMKLFIPDVIAELDRWPTSNMREIKMCIELFLREASCYERIQIHNASADEQIHTPTLYYYGGFRMNVKHRKPIDGYYLLLSYVEEDDTKVTKSMVEQGCRQLQMMGGLGISHDDIARRNCKISNGNIVFLDFSHAATRYQTYNNSPDIRVLKKIFRYDEL